jgi:hypothetical protein
MITFPKRPEWKGGIRIGNPPGDDLVSPEQVGIGYRRFPTGIEGHEPMDGSLPMRKHRQVEKGHQINEPHN